MIPIRDSIPTRKTPYVNYALIAICAITFWIQLSDQAPLGEGVMANFSMIPKRISNPDAKVVIQDYQRDQFGNVTRTAQPVRAQTPALLTLLTCIFLHGSWMHILSNMWFLYIFGDNIEDRLGHVAYAVFYLVCGTLASAIHYFSAMDSTLPTVGASGAIAGVMGAYFLMFPRSQVLTLVPIVFVITFMVIPAQIFLGLWFALQFIQGAISQNSELGGVAWWAHVGGFVVGVGYVLILKATGQFDSRDVHYTPRRELRHYRQQDPHGGW